MDTDSIVVITGAARGIGFELMKQSLARGAKVIAGVRSPEKATELRDLAGKNPGRAHVLPLDVRSDESVAKFTEGLRGLGCDRVDILINNAGVYLDQEAPLDTISPKLVLDTFDTNSVGPIRVTQALLPLLRKAKLARVITISSLMGSITDNSGGGAYAYRMSKAAANMFTKSLSVDEREMIVLTMHPGWVKTSMGGPNAPLAPDKSAEGILTVIETATLGDSGRFFNHAGRDLPW